MKRLVLRGSMVAMMSIAVAQAALAQADSKETFRCPGNAATDPPTYTNTLSPKEARDKGCRTLEGAPITVIQGPKPRTAAPSPASRSADTRVDPKDQRARDSDSKRILQAELQKEEDLLAAMKKEYNNGEPERQGDERNYQKYLDRVNDLKAAIARKESDVAAIRRELSKLP